MGLFVICLGEYTCLRASFEKDLWLLMILTKKDRKKIRNKLLYFQSIYLNMSILHFIIYPAILNHFHYVSVAILQRVTPGVRLQNLQLVHQMWFQCVSEFWGMGNYKICPKQKVIRLQWWVMEKLYRITLDSVVSHGQSSHMKLGHKRWRKRKFENKEKFQRREYCRNAILLKNELVRKEIISNNICISQMIWGHTYQIEDVKSLERNDAVSSTCAGSPYRPLDLHDNLQQACYANSIGHILISACSKW